MAHVTFEQILQILWSFCLGLADSLRGAVDLFLLDSAAVRHKEKKMVQRDLKKEVLLNRDSPARDIVGMENFAKKRALERRERAASTSSTRYMYASHRNRPFEHNLGPTDFDHMFKFIAAPTNIALHNSYSN